jgi:oligoendopeptidase F
MGELQFLHTEASNELLFVSQAWKTIGYGKIMEWSNSPLLSGYRNDLISTAENLKYILSEKEEKTLNIKSRPLSLANDLHDELTGSFEFSMNIHGEEKKLTEEEVRSYRQHTERTIREEAYKSLRRVYNTKQNQITLGNIYTSIVKDWSTDIQLRGYTTVMEPRNLSEEMDNATIDTLIAEVTRAYPLYNRFLKAKARIL